MVMVPPTGLTGFDPDERKEFAQMIKTRVWMILALIGVLVAAMVAAGCGGDDDEDGAEGEDLGLIEEGQLLVGTDTPFPPFEIGQPPDISGYDIDVMNAIAENLGLEVEYQDTSFDTIFRDTANGQFDIAAAASTITPERERTVDFSDPYYAADQSLLVARDSDIQSVDDLGGAIVGAQDATTGEAYANDETDAAEVRGFPEGPDAIAALETGQVDAVIIDLPVAEDAVDRRPDVEIAEELVTRELYGFAMPPGAPLVEPVDEALTELKEDGTIADLYEEYFPGTEPPEEVLEGTHDPT
jgi:polar amino acid transport system substrate-binding protein